MPKNRYALEDIQKSTGCNIQWRGTPQATEIIKETAILCADELISSIDVNVLVYFEKAAKNLIEVMGAEKALCAALAKISGMHFLDILIFVLN